MTFLIGFTNGKMDALTFPERALAVLPKPLILGMFRSLGGAEIDQKKSVGLAQMAGRPGKKFHPLDENADYRISGRAIFPSHGIESQLYVPV